MGHKNAHNNLTAAFIRQAFDYSPETGELRWKNPTNLRRTKPGALAGTTDDQGRIKIGIKGREYFAHRIIWIWVTGKWPTKEVDHINENKTDNTWENLREATPSQNHRNRGKQQNNTTGYKGVTFIKSRNRYIGGVKLNGKRYNCGPTFKTAKEAYAAVRALAKKLHGKWAKYE